MPTVDRIIVALSFSDSNAEFFERQSGLLRSVHAEIREDLRFEGAKLVGGALQNPVDLRQRFFASQGYDVIRESIGHLVLRTWLRLRHEMPAAHSEFGNMEPESAGAWV